MILEYRLQFFAQDGPGGEKTEPATEKKLRDARKDGQVAKSKEIANGLCLLTLFLLLKLFSGKMGNSMGEMFQSIYNKIPGLIKSDGGFPPESGINAVITLGMIKIITISAPVLICGLVVSIFSDYIQVGWAPTGKPLIPKLSKIDPINGFKRFFSLNSVMELLKAVAKIILIGYVSYSYLKKNSKSFIILLDMPLTQGIGLIGSLVINLGIRISVIYMILALTDYTYQKIKFSHDMRMSKQEVKDEFKDEEGNPEVKSKQKQKMQEVSRRRMMQKLPEADVVITNPTHYAVAILYDSKQYDAPVVIAKGADYLAQRIKKVAKEHEIEIVENKPLARMLYANVEIGGQVPPELYQAVAEVLAYVYHLKGKA